MVTDWKSCTQGKPSQGKFHNSYRISRLQDFLSGIDGTSWTYTKGGSSLGFTPGSKIKYGLIKLEKCEPKGYF